ENTEIFSQHGSTGDSGKVPLHSIANIKGFKLACININSLCKHIDEIRYILMSSPLEVLAINESKLDTITGGEIHIRLRYNKKRSK
ncbi:RNA-directed DNA polymerase from transposon BS, partial [Paramuricea clavata]